MYLQMKSASDISTRVMAGIYSIAMYHQYQCDLGTRHCVGEGLQKEVVRLRCNGGQENFINVTAMESPKDSQMKVLETYSSISKDRTGPSVW